ncbi:NF-kappa-b-repressing factor [Plakobranchus ocellatus]|uniref:NF-kappa-b-repressing factor n=1 Tax=Plakobranchus ocellatus TaxID=259542 RepID=A0AAV3Y6A2_9GAST|nr:NF-kappa-b-repressing factor [Plakobranchus ocellatus]
MSRKMKASQKFDADSLRDSFESGREWKLRKMFIDANRDTLTGDRLVCLSKCFTSSTIYGCSYPKQVMDELRWRSNGLLEQHLQEGKSQRLATAKKTYANSFVKASDNKGFGSFAASTRQRGKNSTVWSSNPDTDSLANLSEGVDTYYGHPVSQTVKKYDHLAVQRVNKYGHPVSQSSNKYGHPVSQNSNEYSRPVLQSGNKYGQPIKKYSHPVSQSFNSYSHPVPQSAYEYGHPVSQNGNEYGRPVLQSGKKYGHPVSQSGNEYDYRGSQSDDEYDHPVSQSGNLYDRPVSLSVNKYGHPGNKYSHPVSQSGNEYDYRGSQSDDEYDYPSSQSGNLYDRPVSLSVNKYGHPGYMYSHPVSKSGNEYDYRESQSDDEYDHPVSQSIHNYNHPSSQRGNLYDHPVSLSVNKYGHSVNKYSHPVSQSGNEYDYQESQSDDEYDHPVSQRINKYNHPSSQRGNLYDHPLSLSVNKYGHPLSQSGTCDKCGHPVSQSANKYGNPLSQTGKEYGHPASQTVNKYQPAARSRFPDEPTSVFRQTESEVHRGPSVVEIVDASGNKQGEVDGNVAEVTNAKPSEKGIDPPAKPVLSLEEYKLQYVRETDATLKKLRLMACRALENKQEHAIVKVMHSINKQLRFEVRHTFDEELAKKRGIACVAHIWFDDILAGTGAAKSKARAKRNGFNAALQKVYLPHLRITVAKNGRKEIEGSMEPFPGIAEESLLSQKRCNDRFPSASGAFSTNLLTSSFDEFSPPPAKVLKGAAQRLTPKHLESHQLVEPQVEKAAGHSKAKNESNVNIIVQRLDAGNICVGDFIIVEPMEREKGGYKCTPMCIFSSSASFSGLLLENEFTVLGQRAIRCIAKLEGQIVGEGTGTSKKHAKSEAASNALERLRPLCWNLKVKGPDAAEVISRGELLQEVEQKDEAIGENNVGNQMLRRMGWKGGGVGKDGAGIVEPVSAQGVRGRAGLGLTSSAAGGADFNPAAFREKVKIALKNYVASGSKEHLKLSAEYNKEERIIIHEEAMKFKLRSSSSGRGEKRAVTIRRKLSTAELLHHISQQGGETKSYLLLPPENVSAFHFSSE